MKMTWGFVFLEVAISPNSSSTSSAWTGSGIINKPIGDFITGTFSNNENLSPRFASSSSAVRIVVSNQIIPEPAEYALVFDFLALAFVVVRRHFFSSKA